MVKVTKVSGRNEEHEQGTAVDVRSGVLFVLKAAQPVAVYNAEQWVNAVVVDAAGS